MRLYLKLGLFAVLFVAMHWTMRAYHEQIRMAIFTVRCGMATAAGDQAAIERLVVENMLTVRRESEHYAPPPSR
jgi:hypothetical protein